MKEYHQRELRLKSEEVSSECCVETVMHIECVEDLYHKSGNLRGKNIFVVRVNHKNKKHEIYFTTDNHYCQHIFVHAVSQHSYLVISHETASSSIPKGDSWQTRDNFLSV